MANQTEDARTALMRELKQTAIGMLQAGTHTQAQPMAVFAEPDTDTLWFFTHDDTDLARAVGDATPAQFIFISKDQNLHASMRGPIEIDRDRARIDKFWGPMVSAWYPEGKDDPRLTLLRLDLSEADVWLSPGNPLKVLWEVAKANATKTEPDIGRHEEVKLH